MDVGTQFEAIEKSFIVVSGGAEGAAEDFKFVREEAMRLGAPLTTLAENFARMRAAAGDKMALEDLQQIFIGEIYLSVIEGKCVKLISEK